MTHGRPRPDPAVGRSPPRCSTPRCRCSPSRTSASCATVDRRPDDGVTVHDHPDVLRLPGDGRDPRRRRGRLRRRRPRRRARRVRAVAGVDHRLDERRAGRRKLLEYGIVPPQPRGHGAVPLTLTPALPAVRLAGHPRAEPVRVDRLQVAVGVQRLPGALRPLQGDLTLIAPRHAGVPPARRSPSIEPLTDGLGRDHLRRARGAARRLRASRHGQHLTVRTELAGDDVRRNYSICSPALAPGCSGSRSSGCPAGRSPSTRSTCCGPATCST